MDATNSNRAVFIDRDGTINRDVAYCSCPEDFELLHLVAEGIRLLNLHELKVVVVTNQSGIGQGHFTEEALAEIHQKMRRDLAERSTFVDAIYYCPHHPDDHCGCRKPSPAMLLEAGHELVLDMECSYVIGDSTIDIAMGQEVGCKAILIRTKPRLNDTIDSPIKPDLVVSNVYQAAEWIVNDLSERPEDL